MTGERLVTKVSDHYGTFEHLHRYALAMELCRGKTVLDIASGEGYGSKLVSQQALFVYGVDISEECVSHASRKYAGDKLEFRQGSASQIPLPDHTVDIVVSFETIEHHDRHEEMFSEIKRVLKPGGLLFLSSPEKAIYSERDPGNRFHIKELSLAELRTLCTRHFANTAVYYQKNVIASMIVGDSGSEEVRFFSGDFSHIEPGLREKQFFNRDFFNLVLCSDSVLPADLPKTSFFCAVDAYEAEKKGLTGFRTSFDYRLGHTLLFPLRLVKQLLFPKRS